MGKERQEARQNQEVYRKIWFYYENFHLNLFSADGNYSIFSVDGEEAHQMLD